MSATAAARTTVTCHTSGRRSAEYEVTFDREGLVVAVWHVGPHGKRRKSYSFDQREPMGMTARCAVHAARRVLARAKAEGGAI